MEQFKKVMAEKILIPSARAFRDKAANKEFAAFFANKGKYYDEAGIKLMVIGRALYGWEHKRELQNFSNEADAQDFANEAWKFIYENDDGCPMKWLLEKSEDYNPRKSAFWRVIREIGQGLEVYQKNEPDWTSYIVWSNLYKLNPDTNKNPSEALCDAQYPGCAELLAMEIEEYKPNYILFITGMGWAYPFLFDIEGFKCRTIQSPSVSGRGRYDSPLVHAKVVISVRPERKDETSFVNDIVSSFET